MTVNQIYEIVNSITSEILGETRTIPNEDLSNIVDVGTEIFNANDVDNYVRSLVNHIGKVIFVDRAYSGSAPSVLMDGWEYGSVLEKISAEIPVATENETWELTDKTSYDPNIFYKPEVSAKFFNSKTTFEIPLSFTERQVKESFSNATQLNGFISMLRNSVEKSATIKTDSLIMRTINNFIGVCYANRNNVSKPNNCFINLRTMYNATVPESEQISTFAAAITNPKFIRYAAYIMGIVRDKMNVISTYFNISGMARFTPMDKLHIVMLSEFRRAADVYLQSDTYHEVFTRLPNAETIPYWQAPGSSMLNVEDSSVVKVTPAGMENPSAQTVNGIIAVMFDRDSLGVCNVDRRVTTNYNPKAEFYNNWYKFDASYFNDFNENFVVFTAG